MTFNNQIKQTLITRKLKRYQTKTKLKIKKIITTKLKRNLKKLKISLKKRKKNKKTNL